MKPLLIAFYSFSFILSLHSQTEYEKVFPGNEYPITRIAIQNTCTAAISNSEVIYLDSTGNILWRKFLRYTELTSAINEKVFFDKSGNIVVAGKSNGGCDVWDGANGVYIAKFKPNGDSIFFKRFDIPRLIPFLNINAIELPDSNYLFGYDGNLRWIKPNGDILQNRIYDYLVDLEIVNDSITVALSRDKLTLLDLAGNIREIIVISDAQDAQVYNDTIWMLSQYRVFTYSLLTKEFATLHIPENVHFKGIANDAQGIFIWGDTLNVNRPMVLRFKNESWQTLYKPADNIFTIDDIKWQDNNYYFSGREQFSFIKKTKEFAPLPQKYDIELVNIETVSIDNPNSPFVTFNLDFTIVNKSDTTISSFYLYSDIIFVGFCGQTIQFQKLIFDSLITPGDTLIVRAPLDLPGFVISIVGTTICFHASSPDYYLDLNQDNNTNCRDLLTSTNNILLINNLIKVFPNPASDIIKIQTENNLQIESLYLYNIAGQLQNITSDIHSNQATLQRNNLPAGLYWLKVQTSEGFVMKKVVFQ